MKKLTIAFGLMALVLLSGCASSLEAQSNFYLAQIKMMEMQMSQEEKPLVTGECESGCSFIVSNPIPRQRMQLQRAVSPTEQMIQVLDRILPVAGVLGGMYLQGQNNVNMTNAVNEGNVNLVERMPQAPDPIIVEPYIVPQYLGAPAATGE